MKQNICCFHLTVFLFLITFFGFNSSLSYATDTKTNTLQKSDSILDKVQENYKSIKTIVATFTQDSHSEALSQDEKSKGIFKAFIPNNIKVEYKEPNNLLYLITDEGLTYISYTDQQVVKDSADAVLKSKLPLTFLAGVGDIRKDFKILSIDVQPQNYMFKLEPKEDGEIETLSMWIDKKSLLVNKLFVEELGGNTISFMLSNIVLNKNVKKDDFTVTIPDGFDLIDNTKKW